MSAPGRPEHESPRERAPARLVLCDDWVGAQGDEERATWLRCLSEAMPGETVLPAAAFEPAAASASASASASPDPAEVDVAIVANPPPGSLRRWPGLRLVQSLWAGVDRLLADTTLPAGVPVARMVDPAMNAAMAETALWAVLSLQRDFFRYQRQQREGVWRMGPQRRADETRVTVLGQGQMGGTVARRLAGLGYRVCGWRLGERMAPAQPATAGGRAGLASQGVAIATEDAAGAAASARVELVAGAAALPALLARSDIVVNLLPLTPATRGLLDGRFFAALPPDAALVNLARGSHLVEAELLAALDSGQLRHAVLDVFATEPLPPDHPFWPHPGVTVLPHVAAQTDPRSAAAVVAANVAALRAGRPLAHLVRREAGY